MTAKREPARGELVRVSGDDVARARRATREILSLKREVGRTFYTLGKLLAEVRDDELYHAAGHETFEDYLENEVDISRSSAFKFIRIATSFDQTFALRMGPEKLEAALRYIRATPEDETPSDIPRLRLPVRRGNKTVKKRLVDASAREISAAAQAVNARSRKRAIGAASGRARTFLSRARKAIEGTTARIDVERSGRDQAVSVIVRAELDDAAKAFAALAKVARSV